MLQLLHGAQRRSAHQTSLNTLSFPSSVFSHTAAGILQRAHTQMGAARRLYCVRAVLVVVRGASVFAWHSHERTVLVI